ncbi:hypothetical protein ACFO8Q_07195 [Effusibacillus consociatus]|uniref:Uncharacterized protein n=1 Tax=Effusibacillus consociatus TaxID=1117041 RepID=A0ABV9PZS7_9BACL
MTSQSGKNGTFLSPSSLPKESQTKEKKYPTSQKEYEKLMSHDSYRRVKGRIRQQRWESRQ